MRAIRTIMIGAVMMTGFAATTARADVGVSSGGTSVISGFLTGLYRNIGPFYRNIGAF